MKIMAIDYGDARTGVAISDLLCSIVGSTTVIHSRNQDKTLAELVRLVQEQGVTEIVVGLPKNMDGTEGIRAELCRAFAQRVQEETGLRLRCGMNGAPPWRPTTFFPSTIIMVRSVKTLWMRWRPL